FTFGNGQFEVGQTVEEHFDRGDGDVFGDLLCGIGALVATVGEGQVGVVAAAVVGRPDRRITVGPAQPEKDHVALADEAAAQLHVLRGVAARMNLGGGVLPQHLVEGITDTAARPGQGVGETVV